MQDSPYTVIAAKRAFNIRLADQNKQAGRQKKIKKKCVSAPTRGSSSIHKNDKILKYIYLFFASAVNVTIG